jgi:hypothetical protein
VDLKLIIAEEKEEKSPIVDSLLDLINEAITTGSTFKSWRKSIITMVPKTKKDGSLTSTIKEMRPYCLSTTKFSTGHKEHSSKMGASTSALILR